MGQYGCTGNSSQHWRWECRGTYGLGTRGDSLRGRLRAGQLPVSRPVMTRVGDFQKQARRAGPCPNAVGRGVGGDMRTMILLVCDEESVERKTLDMLRLRLQVGGSKAVRGGY